MGELKWILSLAQQRLETEFPFKLNLILAKMRLGDHPSDHGEQAVRIPITALQADQRSIFVGVGAKSGAATFNQIGQFLRAVGTASAAQQGTQELMAAPLMVGIAATTTANPELGRKHPGS